MLPLSLQTNVTSLFAQQQLETNDNNESNTIEQLTSGYRINSAGDDAAGLAVANELQANVTELQQGVINAANGTSTLQIIDGGLSNISNLLDRLQTLATESASGTFEGSRVTLNNEFQSVLTEITRQAGNVGLATGGTTSSTGTIGSSQYNTTPLAVFIGGGDTGTATDDQVTIDLTPGGTGGVPAAVTGVDAAGLGLTGSDISSASDATTALGLVQTAISDLGSVQGAVGAGENLLNYATSLANSQITNLTASEASIKDANIAADASNLAQEQTLQQSSIAALAQANSMPEAVLKLLQQ
jgi:flagellin